MRCGTEIPVFIAAEPASKSPVNGVSNGSLTLRNRPASSQLRVKLLTSKPSSFSNSRIFKYDDSSISGDAPAWIKTAKPAETMLA